MLGFVLKEAGAEGPLPSPPFHSLLGHPPFSPQGLNAPLEGGRQTRLYHCGPPQKEHQVA